MKTLGVARKQHRSSHAMNSPYCATRVKLPGDDYVVKEKYLRRFRSLIEHSARGNEMDPEVLYGIVNVGPDGDEIWVEKGLREAEKRFVIVHELVHARRQVSGEDFDDEALEEKVVELEAIGRTDRKILEEIPNGLAFTLLHDYLTAGQTISPNTREGLGKIHARISTVLGGIRTAACDFPAWRERNGREDHGHGGQPRRGLPAAQRVFYRDRVSSTAPDP